MKRRKPKVSIRCKPDVKPDIRRHVNAIRRFLPELTEIRHDLKVWFSGKQSVQIDGCDKVAFGIFYVANRNPKPIIAIGAGLADALEEEFHDTRRNAIWAVVETFFHEVAHYEQWRDDKPLQERGVNVRAKTLARQYMFHVNTLLEPL